MENLIKRSFLNAAGTVLYIGLVVTIMHNAEKFINSNSEVLMGLTMLTLFVLSAAITASLVLGKPILMYLNSQKAEAIKMFGYTLGWLAITLIILLVLNLT